MTSKTRPCRGTMPQGYHIVSKRMGSLDARLASAAMRAVIAFKWQAYGESAWLWTVATFFAFFVPCVLLGKYFLMQLLTAIFIARLPMVAAQRGALIG